MLISELQEKLRCKVFALVKGAEVLARQPQIANSTSRHAKDARRYLIQAIHHGDRTLACLRDGENYVLYYDALDNAITLSHRSLELLQRETSCDDTK